MKREQSGQLAFLCFLLAAIVLLLSIAVVKDSRERDFFSGQRIEARR